jgi:uncharacterized protein YkwD
VFTARTRGFRQFLAVSLTAFLAAAPALATTRHHRRHHRHHHAAPIATIGTPQHPCQNVDIPAVGAPVQEMRDAVVCLINGERVKRGLPPLSESSRLDRSAQGWTDLMVVNDIFSHGQEFWNRITQVGYDWSNVGENIATGYPTPGSVVTAWMASKDHCQNILNPNYADVGTGVNPNPVQAATDAPATWTQDFGLLMSANPPSSKMGPSNGCPY